MSEEREMGDAARWSRSDGREKRGRILMKEGRGRVLKEEKGSRVMEGGWLRRRYWR